uniref:G-protein coupled receptors family 1 profile domain-containing protein n=1 Tax=Lates calcarifer TaxID=8187 RepID=A0A4W6CDE3_LATCA
MNEEGRMDNVSSHKHFILNGFNELGALRPVLFIPFSIMYIASVSANSLLLYIVISERSLHSPMYILIAGMASVDLSFPLVCIPSMLLAFQSTFLVWMALDRYFAICTPLYYHERMAIPRFLKFVIPFLIRNFLLNTLMVSLAGTLSFCASNVMNHCFCEHMALVELACGTAFIPVADFLLITVSYIIIFSSVLSSGKTGVKALHTCVTHIVVISVSLTVALTAYLSYRSKNGFPAVVRVFFSIMYLLFPSCFNPIIYGMRTTEIRQHILKTLMCCGFVQTSEILVRNC